MQPYSCTLKRAGRNILQLWLLILWAGVIALSAYLIYLMVSAGSSFNGGFPWACVVCCFLGFVNLLVILCCFQSVKNTFASFLLIFSFIVVVVLIVNGGMIIAGNLDDKGSLGFGVGITHECLGFIIVVIIIYSCPILNVVWENETTERCGPIIAYSTTAMSFIILGAIGSYLLYIDIGFTGLTIPFIVFGIVGAITSLSLTNCEYGQTAKNLRGGRGCVFGVLISIFMLVLIIIGGLSVANSGVEIRILLLEICLVIIFLPCLIIINTLNKKLEKLSTTLPTTSSTTPLTKVDDQSVPLNPVSVPYDPALHGNYVNDGNPKNSTATGGELDLQSYALMLNNNNNNNNSTTAADNTTQNNNNNELSSKLFKTNDYAMAHGIVQNQNNNISDDKKNQPNSNNNNNTEPDTDIKKSRKDPERNTGLEKSMSKSSSDDQNTSNVSMADYDSSESVDSKSSSS